MKKPRRSETSEALVASWASAYSTPLVTPASARTSRAMLAAR